jgi:MFS family permease
VARTEHTTFRGWPIVGVAFFAQLLAFGCSIAVYGLFIPVLTGEFGASFMMANLGLSILGVVMALAGMIVGPLLDRFSIRAFMTVGALVNAVAFAVMSRAAELWQLAVLFGGCVAVGVAMFGPLAANTVVAKWFEKHRGRAVGIASMGPPTGGLLLAAFSGFLIEDYGWRTTLLVFAGLHLLVIPAIWVVVRNSPEAVGQLPDGGMPDESGSVVVEGGRAWATGEVFRSVNFWSLAVALGVVGAVAGAFNANVIPYGVDLGIGLRQSAVALGCRWPAGRAFCAPAFRGTRLLGAVCRGACVWCGCRWIGTAGGLGSGPGIRGVLVWSGDGVHRAGDVAVRICGAAIGGLAASDHGQLQRGIRLVSCGVCRRRACPGWVAAAALGALKKTPFPAGDWPTASVEFIGR